MVIDPLPEGAAKSGGLASVRIGDDKTGKWGYIDKSGGWVISPQFDAAEQFSEGLAAVQIAGKYGYIDKRGDWIIPPQFDRAEQFSEGLAAVKIAEKYGYIDNCGRYVINPQFDEAGQFTWGMLRERD